MLFCLINLRENKPKKLFRIKLQFCFLKARNVFKKCFPIGSRESRGERKRKLLENSFKKEHSRR